MNKVELNSDNIRSIEDPLYNLLTALRIPFTREDALAIVNPESTSGEPTTYLSFLVEVAGHSFRSCTCSSYRYQLPTAAQIMDKETSLEELSEIDCKHIEEETAPSSSDSDIPPPEERTLEWISQ